MKRIESINAIIIFSWVALTCFSGLQKAIAQDNCGNNIMMQHIIHDLTYQQALEETNQRIYNVSATTRGNDDSILIIPVVVHILHTGENIGVGSNVNEARILAALNTANREWNDTDDRGGNMAIEFCLAQTDPNGNPTSGIDRINASSIPGYTASGIAYGADPGADETTLKQLSNWPHDRYYNIWVVNKIAGGWAGFAYYPTTYNFSNDGTIITAASMNANNKVLAHELGHGVGLYHTFEGGDKVCPPNTNCTTEGDRVCDTPPHKINDCVTTTCSDSPDLIFSTFNIMSYCSLTRKLFTEGQKVRCRNAVFTTTRAALLKSDVCNFPCETAITTEEKLTCNLDSVMTVTDTLQTSFGCDSIVTTVYSYLPTPEADFDYTVGVNGQVDFELLSSINSNTTVLWKFGDGGTSGEINPSHHYLTSGSYDVVLLLITGCGEDSLKVNITLLPTGIKDHTATIAANIFPNPSAGSFTLEMNVYGREQAKLWVLNMLGQLLEEIPLYPGNVHDIKLENVLAVGMYQLQIFIGDQPVKTTKLLLK